MWGTVQFSGKSDWWLWEIWPKKWSKWHKNYRSREYLEKYERIESSIQRQRKYYGGQNWLGRGVLAHHPEDPSLEFRDFTDFHRIFLGFFWEMRHGKGIESLLLWVEPLRSTLFPVGELGIFIVSTRFFEFLLITEVGRRCWDIGSLSWTLPWWALKIRDFHSFHQTFWTFFTRWGISKVLGGFLKLNANLIFLIFKKYSTSYGTSKLPYGPCTA